MEPYVDPVRIWLLGFLPIILSIVALLVSAKLHGRERLFVPENSLVHAAAYLLLIQVIYVSGNYSAAGFFLFPSDQIVRTINFDQFTGAISLVAVSLLWGFLLSRVHRRLRSVIQRWHSPRSLSDRIAITSACVMAVVWVRYLMVYPLLIIPSLYLPGSIYRTSFTLDVFMINWCLPLFAFGFVAALLSTRKLLLVAVNLVYVFGVVCLIPLTTLLA